VLLLVIAAAASGGGYYYYVYARPYERTDDAFIEGSITRVSPQVPGQVVRVHVEDNQPVNAGDLLVEIDPRPYEVRLDTARAALRLAETRVKTARVTVDLTRATTDAGIDQAEAEVDAAKAAVEQAHAEVAAAEAEAKRAETDSQRYDNLDESAVSRQRRDLADATARVASARLMEAHKQVVAGEARVAAALGRLASAKTGPQQVAASESQAEQAVAGVEQAKAAVRGAELDLSYTKVYAPMSGHVTRKSVRVGENVQAGQALFSIVPDDVWIIANFKETQLTRMRPGQPVTIRVDVYPAVAFAGHVDSIQGGTGARFSLLPPENATGNYVKVVQRVPVKILFDAKPGPDLFLAPGMSVVPRVRVR
jgi:membrane fusion protein (multidrug efflux system)